MKWRLIKLLCIAGAGILGALLFGDAVAGVVIAPFGWIIGRAVELHATAKKMGITEYRTAVAEGSEQEWLVKDPFSLNPLDMELDPFNLLSDD